ncbi:MAG: gamma-glutamylcyclotransferase [Casimicrobiaceae bacterium]|nr:gamma-glutamylcyclotransferase [Casimicrobiaceae bacterium]
MSHDVFTYGSLMFPVVWQRVVRGRYESVPGTVHGFRRLVVRGESYPGLVATRRSDTARGILYLEVSDEDLDRLDRFEGPPYVRLTTPVHLDDGRLRLAQTYLATPALALERKDWDPDRFAREGLERFLREYCAARAETR